ncbi:striatin-interacting [Brachionus plicatilis]|uniref:Striatin-interacting n=1 Tax=Brachionus plicatilis TaxID=10195 RepID=A0A3M7RFT5_BRAPC|nr:striatin-interacting [Brachionus plicatilis]
MLKHFKTNHFYQFEFMSQHLLFANCVPLILKIFNINISSFVQSKNNNFNLDFPNCVIGTQSDIDVEELENGDSSIFRWRNVFSCINLLRVLNKLTKYKRSRIMMLVIFKSAPIFKKMLRIKQPMLQYYALKLLKMQTRHLGRQWRKTNMSTMSAIYQKVRHRLNDDWAFGNEQETQAWDFQSDEFAIRTKIDKYIQRKYKTVEEPLYPEFMPVDNSFYGCLKQEIDLPEDFEDNYEKWLEEEVFNNQINWDLMIDGTKKSILY